MLHPDLTRALATSHIEDQLRTAARWRTIRLARRARATHGGDVQSPYSDPGRLDSVDSGCPGPRVDTNRDSPSSPMATPGRFRLRWRLKV
jgi:hypothetical protein